MQKNDALTPFFREFQETSYYFSNSFEGFMNYFIRTPRRGGGQVQDQDVSSFHGNRHRYNCGATCFSAFFLARDVNTKLLKVEQAFPRCYPR
ncbi:hypothetical protein [Marispirochaeta aestuarii]|uniref:hypothetical protein n=1 Tax=Marispirochaeta aestuarii TaxID=1963862 RepID=UPI0029C61388|nr:hypothetical protein [Marispirochaeta aestuarii]